MPCPAGVPWPPPPESISHAKSFIIWNVEDASSCRYNKAMRHVLSALVHNQPGVLAHVSGMLASRGFNIDSLAVGETEDPNLSRMTFVVHGDDAELEQVRKQLHKVVTVAKFREQ